MAPSGVQATEGRQIQEVQGGQADLSRGGGTRVVDQIPEVVQALSQKTKQKRRDETIHTRGKRKSLLTGQQQILQKEW